MAENEINKPKSAPAWKPISLDTAPSGAGAGGEITADVMSKLQKELEKYRQASKTGLGDEEKELLELARAVPKDELRKLASKHIMKSRLGWTEGAENSNLDYNKDKGGESMDNNLQKELAEIKTAIKELTSALTTLVKEPPKPTEPVSTPQEEPQNSPVTPKEKADAPLKVSTPQEQAKKVVEPPKQETVSVPSDTPQERPVLGQKEVKSQTPTPGMSVSQKKVVEPPKQEAVSMPSAGAQDKVVREEITTGSSLPGGAKEPVTVPKTEEQTKPICARFARKFPITNSRWTVYAGKTPLFSVSARQAYTEPHKYVEYFCSKDYGKDLIKEIKKNGVIPTLEKYYGGGRHATVYFAQDSAIPAEKGTPGVVSDEKFEELTAPEPTPKLDTAGLGEALALFFYKSDADLDEILQQFKTLVTSKEQMDKLFGVIETKYKELEESETAEEGVKEEKVVQSIVRLAQESDAFKAVKDLLDELSKETTKGGEKNEAVSEMKDLLNKAETKTASMKDLLNKAEKRIAFLTEELDRMSREWKAHKVGILIEAMKLRGLVNDDEAEQKSKELMTKSMDALDTLAEEIVKIPTQKREAIAGTMDALPLLDTETTAYFNVTPTTSEKAWKEKTEGVQFFSTPPVIDPKEKKVIKESKW